MFAGGRTWCKLFPPAFPREAPGLVCWSAAIHLVRAGYAGMFYGAPRVSTKPLPAKILTLGPGFRMVQSEIGDFTWRSRRVVRGLGKAIPYQPDLSIYGGFIRDDTDDNHAT